jgi:transcriptional regulator of acetoin/glycerol metabolism
MDVLTRYSYPGNVRQLEHIIQRAVATARSSDLTPDDLPEELLAEPVPTSPGDGTVAAAREKAEREMIVATLARHRGEIGAAARELQVSRTTMWRLMKKHNVEA